MDSTKEIPDRLPQAAPTVLRIGIALMFLWFGVEQLLHSEFWVGFVPDWITSVSSLAANDVVRINGAFEVIFGILLLAGFFTRLVAFVLMVHLLHISLTLDNPGLVVRDIALAIATCSIFLFGADRLTVDRWRKRGREERITDEVARERL